MKFRPFLILTLFLSSIMVSTSACGVRSGCPAEKTNSVKYDRKGRLKSGGNKSTHLFGKDRKY